MTARESDQERAERQALADAAAEQAVAAVVGSYAHELAGRRLNRQQQLLADRAARLARYLVRRDHGKEAHR